MFFGLSAMTALASAPTDSYKCTARISPSNANAQTAEILMIERTEMGTPYWTGAVNFGIYEFSVTQLEEERIYLSVLSRNEGVVLSSVTFVPKPDRIVRLSAILTNDTAYSIECTYIEPKVSTQN
jgi:hypothetical protein